MQSYTIPIVTSKVNEPSTQFCLFSSYSVHTGNSWNNVFILSYKCVYYPSEQKGLGLQLKRVLPIFLYWRVIKLFGML